MAKNNNAVIKKQKEQHPIRGNLKSRQDYQFGQAEELIQAINHGSSICRGLYLAFLALTAFLLIIISTTNDYNLLVLTPIKLPIFGADVDLVGFYRYAPWVYFLAHVNLLMTIALLTRKLAIFHSKLSILPFSTRELLRSKLHIFAPIQYLSKQQKGVVSFILWIIVKVLLVLMPPFILLLIQIDSLAMQDHITVWLQRAAVVVDMLFAFFLWRHLLQGRARPLAEVRLPGGKPPRTARERANAASTAAVYVFILSLSVLGATIPFSSLEARTAFSINIPFKTSDSQEQKNDEHEINQTKQQVSWFEKGKCNKYNLDSIKNYSKECQNPIKRLFFDGVIDQERRSYLLEYEKDLQLECKKILGQKDSINKNFNVSNNDDDYCLGLKKVDQKRFQLVEAKLTTKQEQRCITPVSDNPWQPLCWFKGTRWLDQLDQQIPNGVLTANVLSTDVQNRIRSGVLNGYQKRNEENALHDNQELSESEIYAEKIVGYLLRNRSLNKANLTNLYLPKVNLSNSSLIGADLSGARLHGADFANAELHSVDLSGAKLHSTVLWGVQAHGVDLSNAELHGAYFWSAELFGADLSWAELYGTDLTDAKLYGADLNGSKLNGADLSWAELYGADLSDAKLHGANLSGSQLHGADLSWAQLYGTDLNNAQLHGADLSRSLLLGVNFFKADLADALLSGMVVTKIWPSKGDFFSHINKVSSISEKRKNIINSRVKMNLKSFSDNLDFKSLCTVVLNTGDIDLIEKLKKNCQMDSQSFSENEIDLIAKGRYFQGWRKRAKVLCSHADNNSNYIKYIPLGGALASVIEPEFCVLRYANARIWAESSKDSVYKNKVKEFTAFIARSIINSDVQSFGCKAEDQSNPTESEVESCSSIVFKMTDRKVNKYLSNKQ